MEHIAIRYTPTAIVTFTTQEAQFMLACAFKHYDAVCREAAMGMIQHESNRPGFLRAISNCIANAGQDYRHKLTFLEIDTLAKIIENPPPGEIEPKGLASNLLLALVALNENVIEDKLITE